MALISRQEIIMIAIKRNFDYHLINFQDINAAEFNYIKEILTEDLYNNVIDNPDDYLIDSVDTSGIVKSYISGDLSVNGTAITSITIADPAVFTLNSHGFENEQEVRIEKKDGKNDSAWSDLLADQVFVISDKAANTFQLKTSLQTKYIKPCLAYFVVYDIFNQLFVELSERGVYNLTANNAQVVSNQTRTEARNDYYRQAQSLARILKKYVEDQVEDEVAVYQDYYDSTKLSVVSSHLVDYAGESKRSNHI